MPKKVIFINSHPIQYFAPLYKYMNMRGIETEAWYCSDESVKGGYDAGFGTEVKWDIPLLEGYRYRFFTNHSPKPSHFNGFFGLINFGLIKQVFHVPKSIIVVHGWHYFTLLFVLLLAGLKGHTVCLRCEMPQNQEQMKTGMKQRIKRFLLRYILFPRVDRYLYIGQQNRLFYLNNGVKEKDLLFCPYCVDNDRFSRQFEQLIPFIQDIKSRHGIPADDKIVLFAGKYIDKKKPLDILHSFTSLNHPGTWLIMLGEGELRKEMETFISSCDLRNVILTGFVNQSKIAEYYTISDVFVMCSTVGETWGLSVNEAMNFELPLLVSHHTGCAADLVKEGKNGYIFTTGDREDLTNKLSQLFNQNIKVLGKVSKTIVDEYAYRVIADNINLLL